MGTWAPIETKPYASPDFDYASFPFPKTTGDHYSARADFSGFAVPATAKHADAAQKFAAFVLGEKYQKLSSEAGQLPIREDGTPPAVQEGVWKHLQEADGFHQQNDGVAFPEYNQNVFELNNDKLILGKMDAQQFVDAMAQGTKEYWEQQD